MTTDNLLTQTHDPLRRCKVYDSGCRASSNSIVPWGWSAHDVLLCKRDNPEKCPKIPKP